MGKDPVWEKWECERKRGYKKERQAQDVIKRKKKVGHLALYLVAYQCTVCNLWHVGNKRKTEDEEVSGN